MTPSAKFKMHRGPTEDSVATFSKDKYYKSIGMFGSRTSQTNIVKKVASL